MADKTPEEIEFDKAKKYGGDTRSWMRIHLKALKEAAGRGDLKECRRIVDLFRKEEAKLPGVYARMRRALDAYKKAMERGVAASAAALVFPADVSALVDKGDASTDGAKMTRVEDASGQVWLKREAADAESGGEDQLKSEAAADSVYATFGIGAPMSRMYGDVKLTQDVGGVSLTDFLDGSASDAEKNAARDQFMDGLDVDCMLSNWSCVGGNSDTRFAVIKDGRVYRTGAFAALSYRVKGGTKGSGAWGEDPKDFFKLWTFANQKKVLGGRQVNVLELMKKTKARNWDSVKRFLADEDWKVIEKRLANIDKVIKYGEQIVADDPNMDVSDLNNELERFVGNRYKEPKRAKQVLSDPNNDKLRIPVDAKAKIGKPDDIQQVSQAYKHANLNDKNAYKVIERMNAEDKTDAPPIIAKTRTDFMDMVGDVVGFRTIKDMPAIPLEDQIRDLKDGNFYIACEGGRVHGFGMYVNVCDKTKGDMSDCESGSKAYGRSGTWNATFLIGVTKDFKWGLESEIANKAYWSGKSCDTGVMARALGYDGYMEYDVRGNSNTSYAVILNRSKTVILEKQDLWQ